jgi:hypothetical protein
VANSPLRFIDPDGRIIIDAKTGKVVLFDDKGKISNPADLSLELLSAFEQLGRSEKMQSVIKRVSESAVKVNILIGTEKAIKKHTGVVGVTKGGTTNYDFEAGEVRIGVHSNEKTPLTRLAALADELSQTDQFLRKKIAFGEQGPSAYDQPDELENKQLGADVLIANELSGDVLVNEIETHSASIINLIMKGGTYDEAMAAMKKSGYGTVLNLPENSVDVTDECFKGKTGRSAFVEKINGVDTVKVLNPEKKK